MYTRGDLAEATQLVDRALRLDPTSVDALLLRGRLHEHRQQDDAALAAYCRAFQADRLRLEPQLRMAEVHLRRRQPRQSGAILRGVLERTDLATADLSRAHWLLGQSYAQEQRWNEATASLQKAAEDRRMTADDWYQLAFAAYRAGDFSLSRQSATAALQIDPQHASATAIHDLLVQQTASK
jgi:tetratricopeptide (TPR) repeat protein